jgi:hypothetical protein
MNPIRREHRPYRAVVDDILNPAEAAAHRWWIRLTNSAL